MYCLKDTKTHSFEHVSNLSESHNNTIKPEVLTHSYTLNGFELCKAFFLEYNLYYTTGILLSDA